MSLCILFSQSPLWSIQARLRIIHAQDCQVQNHLAEVKIVARGNISHLRKNCQLVNFATTGTQTQHFSIARLALYSTLPNIYIIYIALKELAEHDKIVAVIYAYIGGDTCNTMYIANWARWLKKYNLLVR